MMSNHDPESPIEIITSDTPISRVLGFDARGKDGAGAAGTLLADYLATDIQGSVAAATALAAKLATPLTTPWRRSGNAFTLDVTTDAITITDDYPNGDRANTAVLTHAEFVAGLRLWIDALTNRL